MLRFLRPGWLLVHVFVFASAVIMVFLGRWQWHVGVQRNGMQNYAYALQWWAFVGFAFGIWIKVMRDVRHRQGVESGQVDAVAAPVHHEIGAPYRGYAMPQSADIAAADPALQAYNDYLSSLDEHDKATRAPVRPGAVAKGSR